MSPLSFAVCKGEYRYFLCNVHRSDGDLVFGNAIALRFDDRTLLARNQFVHINPVSMSELAIGVSDDNVDAARVRLAAIRALPASIVITDIPCSIQAAERFALRQPQAGRRT